MILEWPVFKIEQGHELHLFYTESKKTQVFFQKRPYKQDF